MMDEKILIISLLVLLITLQYRWGRKLNLKLIRGLSSSMEEAFQPVKAEYTWIGGYVGVVADYKLKTDNYTEAKLTISLLPRHSLFYLPVSLLTGKRDRVQILIKARSKIPYSSIHFKTGRWIKPPEGISELKRGSRGINGEIVHYWYKNKETLVKFMELFENLKIPGGIKHLAVNQAENAIYADLKITDNTAVEFIKAFLKLSI